MAVPSFKNSGLEHSPRSTPIVLELDFARIGLTVLLVVPGITVLLTMTRLYDCFCRRALPNSSAAVSMYVRSIEPSFRLGVPTVRKIEWVLAA